MGAAASCNGNGNKCDLNISKLQKMFEEYDDSDTDMDFSDDEIELMVNKRKCN